jgi:hypothetical protein
VPFSARPPHQEETAPRNHNLGTLHCPYNQQLWCSASDQWLGGGGAGNADPGAGGGPAAAFGGFGFFGRIIFRAGFGGGPAGCSSAITGLGSTFVDAGVVKSAGVWTTCTGTVAGWKLFNAKVTEKPLSGSCTETEQGVLQPGPSEVRASAPGGVDSSWTGTTCGAGLNASRENEEQPARLNPATAITMTRRMANPSLWCG